MIIEFIGAPGAGKTTLIPTVIEFFQERGVAAFTLVEAARPYAQRTIWGQVVARWAPQSLRRPLLWQVFYRLSSLYKFVFRARHRRLIQMVLASQKGRPAAADARRRKVLYWFFRLTGTYEFLRAQARPDEVLVCDEGFVHRVVQLFTSSVEKPDQAQIKRYVDLVPQPDLVIFVRAARETCESRIYRRGLWERWQHKDPAEISRFVAHAHRAVTLTVDCVRSKGWPVVEVNNEGDDLTAAQAALRRQLAQTPTFAGQTLDLQVV